MTCDDVGAGKEFQTETAQADRDQQRQHQMVGRPGDVADALDHEAARPQSEQAAGHGEAGDHAKGLNQHDGKRNRLQEITQVAQKNDRQRKMENPAEQPDPFVGA